MDIITIIVTYNGEPYIRRCLEALRNAEEAGRNHIMVIDNDSGDATCEIIEDEFPDVELIRSKENLGFGKANNIGLREALKRKVPYVFLLNQDAYVDPDTVRRLREVADSHAEYGILSPLQLNGEGTDIDYTFYPYCLCSCRELVFEMAVQRDNLKPVYPVYFTNAAAWFIPLEFLKQVGGFAPVYPHYGEDNDMINRCHYHGFKVGICPDVSVRHDRPQQERTLKEKTTARLAQEGFIRSLIIFTNIGDRISDGFKVAVVRSIRNQIVDFHPKKIVAELWGWMRLSRFVGEIRKTRQQAVNKAPSFID